ncbi:MAG: hypothetical protein MI806_28895, partial [Minwuiales bacterium]|nr:hypothetical protein [Minwuiales bacterium]
PPTPASECDVSLWHFYRAWRQSGDRAPIIPIPIPLPIRYLWDNRAAETDLGWKNRSFADGLAETMQLENTTLSP